MLIYLIFSGQLFFGAVALLLGAMVAPKRLAGVMGLLALPLAAVSGSLFATILVLLGFLAWSVGGFGRRRDLSVIGAVIGILAAVTELPFHLRGRQLEMPSRIFVIGDSLASGGFGEGATWPLLLQQNLRVPVLNLSLASSDTALALERQMTELPAPLDRRELVLIEIGGNDMLDGVPPAKFAAALDELLTLAGKGRQVAMLEFPLLPGRWSYGAIQRQLAKKHRCKLIPKRMLAGVLTGRGNTFDGIHLTENGHRALADELLRYFVTSR
jgi:acyl-CoA thioesterase-1